MKQVAPLFMLVLPWVIYAQSSLKTVGQSTKIDDEITVKYTQGSLDYYIDEESEHPNTLAKTDYFQITSEEFRMYAEFLNPLQYRFSTASKAIDDELNKASEEFLSAAVSYLQELRTPATGRSTKVRGGQVTPADTVAYTLEPQLLDIYLFLKDKKPGFFASNDALYKQLHELDFYENKEKIQADYAGAFKGLQGIDKLQDIAQVVKKNQTTFDGHGDPLDDLKFRLKTLKNSFEWLDFQQAFKAEASVTEAYVQTRLQSLDNEVTAFLNSKEELSTKYETLKKLFNDLEAGPLKGDTRFRLLKITDIDRKKRHEITLNVEKLKYDAKDKTLSVEEKHTWTIQLRRYQALVPVVSSGVLYSNLSFDQYGTDTDEEGTTIVTQTADEENEISIGAYLNLYLNPVHNVPVYAQFGVGPSKEKPLFFLGAGVEFLERISVSSGMVFTWFPELDELSVGDPVSGTSAIEEDISFQFDTSPKFYIGINFNITKKDKDAE